MLFSLYIGMTVSGAIIGVSCGTRSSCPDEFGCAAGVCPDFTIRRHDTRPPFKVSVEDCDGPMDLTDLVLEVNMWAKGKLKTAITTEDTYFGLADNIGFQQIMVGDVIVMDRVRLPEKMLVTAFDETNRLVQVQRAYQGTTAQAWKKGTPLRIMRIISSAAETEMEVDDILQTDGTTLEDQIIASYFIYEWAAGDTCLPGCYYLEFKLLAMAADEDSDFNLLSCGSCGSVSITPSFTDTSLTPTNFGCTLGDGVEWVRRFPQNSEGYLIRVIDSPTSE